VAGPDDFVLAEPNDQFGGHESWHYVAPHDLFSLLCQLRQEASRPRPVAEQFGDLTPLAVVLMLGGVSSRNGKNRTLRRAMRLRASALTREIPRTSETRAKVQRRTQS
jgi:hypothetical protein